MRWLIASDIHGSFHYCSLLIERYCRENAERMLLLGDLLYHGPRNDLPEGYSPRETADALNRMKCDIACVRGNCEAEVDQMMLEFPVMADYALMEYGKKIFYLTHGHLAGPDRLPPLKEGDILLSGHTHVPMCEVRNGILCINPGSCSIPKNGSPYSYMTFEDGVFEWKNIEDGSKYMEYKL